MSYTKSQAFPGRGSKIAISNDAVSPEFILIGEVKNIKPAGRKIDKYDASNMESGMYKEYKTGMIDPGTYAVTINGVPTDAGQVALEESFTKGTIHTWGVLYPPASIANPEDTVPQLLEFQAFIEELPHEDLDVTKLAERSFTIQITGAISVTPEGSAPAPF